jgi:hypothetical protein
MKTLDHFFATPIRRQKRRRTKQDDAFSTPSSAPSPSSIKSFGTPETTLSSTPRTPPSPVSTPTSDEGDGNGDCDTLTPPSPQSVFDRTPPSVSMASPQSDPPTPLKITKRKRHRTTEQLYLDFGQASFGAQTICSVCNMLYVNGLKEDEDNHRKLCSEYAQGVLFNMWKHARIVYRHEDSSQNGGSSRFCMSISGTCAGNVDGEGAVSIFDRCNNRTPIKSVSNTSKANNNNVKNTNGCIVEVKESDSIQLRRRVLKVKSIVDKELGFWNKSSNHSNSDINANSDNNIIESASLGGKTVYIYIENKRVVGFCSVEVISKAFQLHPNEDMTNKQGIVRNNQFVANRSTKSSKAMMGIHQLWCHRSHRKKGIATMLIDTARSKLVYGMTVPLNMVAFSSPTSDGAMFARQYTDTQMPLVYDCH